MKLWLLRPVESSDRWETYWDCTYGYVICAETEERARALAFDASSMSCEGQEAWILPEHSTCVELKPGEIEEVIMCDYLAG